MRHRFCQVFLISILFGILPVSAYSEFSQSDNNRPQYIFLLIADGMGFTHLQMTDIYHKNNSARQPHPTPSLAMAGLPVVGIAKTHSANASITDSAAAGTALAAGHKTNNGVIMRSPDLKTDYESLAIAAKRKGMKAGILSSVSLDHATPAVFYSHQNSRKMYYSI